MFEGGNKAHIYWDRSVAAYEKVSKGATIASVAPAMRDFGTSDVVMSEGSVIFRTTDSKSLLTTTYTLKLVNGALIGSNESSKGKRNVEGHCD